MMIKITDHKIRAELLDAQNNMHSLIQLVLTNMSPTEIQRRMLKHAAENIVRIEAQLSGKEELPFRMDNSKALRSLLNEQDHDA